MPELVVSEVDTETLIRPQPAIERAATAVTAFIGRALKGPVDQPIAVSQLRRLSAHLRRSVAAFHALLRGRAVFRERRSQLHRRAGLQRRSCADPDAALWRGRRSTLIGLSPGYARISARGGRLRRHRARPTRIASTWWCSACAPPAPSSSRSRRSSAASRSGRIAERAATRDAGASRNWCGWPGELPLERPESHGRRRRQYAAVGYLASNPDGDDGDPLTNYDIIGDARSGTGLFALLGEHTFNFLCVPPLSREQDVGLPALLVALRLCRERQAMLLVDPPAAWDRRARPRGDCATGRSAAKTR